jgi:hypothetical protein
VSAIVGVWLDGFGCLVFLICVDEVERVLLSYFFLRKEELFFVYIPHRYTYSCLMFAAVAKMTLVAYLTSYP